MHLDSQGLIVQSDGDGGDSLQRAASFQFISVFRNIGIYIDGPRPWREAHGLYCVKPGIYVRHPDPTKWYSDERTTSRDQLIPVFMALGISKMYRELWALTWAVIRRGFFAQNIYRNWEAIPEQKPKVPDTFLGHIHVMIRAWGWWALPLYPILLIWDLFTLIGEGIQLLPWRMQDGGRIVRRSLDDADDNNSINQHIQAVASLPTPLSWLSRTLYARFRPLNNGVVELGETNNVMGALVWYHRKESGGNPEMAELYRPVIEKYFI